MPPTTEAAQASPPVPRLRFTELYRSFGRLSVLRNVAGAATTGEILLVTGANGSGKSTLLKCLAGLLAPDRGRVELSLDGRELSIDEIRRAVGYAAPDLAFYEELTTEENLLFFARLRRLAPDRVAELLEHVGLPTDRAAGALSSGMRQRLRWCWALLHRPPVLLLDEPFQNLDEPGRQAGTELLVDHLRHGLAVVANPGRLDLPYVTHHLELAG
ncbi:MAG: ABC transporter ATP-binding protein [Acidobacteria bacterium]|nr:ABC transporter ATP-binding protein [Acidobacteriota bacterium]